MNGRVSPRHPAARAAGVDLARTAGILARRGAVAGLGPYPSVALALQAVRGRQRRSVADFARAYGLTETEVRDAEAGRVAGGDVAAVLRHLTPLERIRCALDADPAGGPPARSAGQPSEPAPASASASARAQR